MQQRVLRPIQPSNCRHEEKKGGAGLTAIGEFPKIRSTLFGGPYDEDPTI